MKVYVGSAIWRSVEVGHMASLVPLLRTPGFGYYPQVGDALIDRARGISATYFLEQTDCDIHLSIDSDITGFTVEDTQKLCEAAMTHDIVGGVYVCRAPVTYPASYYLDNEVVVHAFDHTPVEVKFLATGFMAVHRRVFEKLAETVPVSAPNDPKHYYTFYAPITNYMDEDVGQPIELSEDWAFCLRAKEAGFKCYIDPAIRLGHIGNYTYTLEDMLRERLEPQPMAIHREGTHWSAWGLSSPDEAAKAREIRERALTRV